MKRLTAAGMPWGQERNSMEEAVQIILPIAQQLGMGEEEIWQMLIQAQEAGMEQTSDMTEAIIGILKELKETEESLLNNFKQDEPNKPEE